MTLDKRLLDLLACPVCKGPLEYRRAAEALVCRFDRLLGMGADSTKKQRP